MQKAQDDLLSTPPPPSHVENEFVSTAPPPPPTKRQKRTVTSVSSQQQQQTTPTPPQTSIKSETPRASDDVNDEKAINAQPILNVYVCVDHSHDFPQQPGAVVIAQELDQARALLDNKLVELGFDTHATRPYTFHILKPTTASVTMLATLSQEK